MTTARQMIIRAISEELLVFGLYGLDLRIRRCIEVIKDRRLAKTRVCPFDVECFIRFLGAPKRTQTYETCLVK